MRITDARVIVCSPGRNFVTLKLTTEDGLYGVAVGEISELENNRIADRRTLRFFRREQVLSHDND